MNLEINTFYFYFETSKTTQMHLSNESRLECTQFTFVFIFFSKWYKSKGLYTKCKSSIKACKNQTHDLWSHKNKLQTTQEVCQSLNNKTRSWS